MVDGKQTTAGGGGVASGKRLRTPVASAERIAEAILVLRGQKVLLDADLAALYEVVDTRA